MRFAGFGLKVLLAVGLFAYCATDPQRERRSTRFLTPGEASLMVGGQSGIKGKECQTNAGCVIQDGPCEGRGAAVCESSDGEYGQFVGSRCTLDHVGWTCNQADYQVCIYFFVCEWKNMTNQCEGVTYIDDDAMGYRACISGPQ